MCCRQPRCRWTRPAASCLATSHGPAPQHDRAPAAPLKSPARVRNDRSACAIRAWQQMPIAADNGTKRLRLAVNHVTPSIRQLRKRRLPPSAVPTLCIPVSRRGVYGLCMTARWRKCTVRPQVARVGACKIRPGGRNVRPAPGPAGADFCARYLTASATGTRQTDRWYHDA